MKALNPDLPQNFKNTLKSMASTLAQGVNLPTEQFIKAFTPLANCNTLRVSTRRGRR